MYFIHNFVRNLTTFNNLFAHEVVFLLFCPLFAFKRGDRDWNQLRRVMKFMWQTRRQQKCFCYWMQWMTFPFLFILSFRLLLKCCSASQKAISCICLYWRWKESERRYNCLRFDALIIMGVNDFSASCDSSVLFNLLSFTFSDKMHTQRQKCDQQSIERERERENLRVFSWQQNKTTRRST